MTFYAWRQKRSWSFVNETFVWGHTKRYMGHNTFTIGFIVVYGMSLDINLQHTEYTVHCVHYWKLARYPNVNAIHSAKSQTKNWSHGKFVQFYYIFGVLSFNQHVDVLYLDITLWYMQQNWMGKLICCPYRIHNTPTLPILFHFHAWKETLM